MVKLLYSDCWLNAALFPGVLHCCCYWDHWSRLYCHICKKGSYHIVIDPSHSDWLKPQVSPKSFLHCRNTFGFLKFLHTCSIWKFHESLLSRYTPRNFVDVHMSMSFLSSFRGIEKFHFLFLVNITEWVFIAYIFSPISLHHSLMALGLFCVIGLTVLVSNPPQALGDSVEVISAISFAKHCLHLTGDFVFCEVK